MAKREPLRWQKRFLTSSDLANRGFVATAGLLAVVALVACYLPARRGGAAGPDGRAKVRIGIGGGASGVASYSPGVTH